MNTAIFGPPAYTYTRADALADGTLTDVSTVASEAGIPFPVALTSAVWEKCVAWNAEDNRRKRTANDESGRLWDVLWMFRRSLRHTSGPLTELRYCLRVVPREGTGHVPRVTFLKSVCGPGDAGEPVITITLPDES